MQFTARARVVMMNRSVTSAQMKKIIYQGNSKKMLPTSILPHFRRGHRFEKK